MKKNKRHLYKRLPKYALGTMKPMDMGYQQARGIGNVKFDTELNMSLDPETLAIEGSYIPNAIGKFAQYSPYVTEAVKDWTPASSATVSNNATNAMRSTSFLAPSLQSTTATNIIPQAKALSQMSLNLTNPMETAITNAASQWNGSLLSSASSLGSGLSAGLGSSLGSSLGSGLASTGFAGLGEKSAEKFFGLSGSSGTGGSASGASAGSGVLGVAGKIAAGLGTAIGAYNIYNDIAGFGDHRSASDMLTNVGRQRITTDMGNSYTNYNGVNAGQELAYEKANARSKQLGFGMNAIGTGASVGSFFGPVGAGIGAAAGLLLGGLGSLFGWGDNSDEIERLTKLTNDNIANYNRQQEAVAKSKDIAAEFSDRQGVSAAATGKEAGGNMENGSNIDPNKIQPVFGIDGWSFGFPSSVGMSGELLTIGRGKNRKYTIIPSTGNKKDDNKDSIPLKDVKPGSPHTIVRKDLAKLTKDVLDGNYREDFKDWYVDQVEELQSEERYNKDMKKYKNGKLPGYWRGTDYLMSAIPHLAAMGASWNLYNRAKYADTHAPSTYVSNAAGAQALNELAQLRFDPTQYLTDARRAYNQANFQANRMAGLGAGGQAILRNTNYLNYLDSLGKIRIAQQDADNKYRTAHASALAEYGAREQEALINDNIRRFQWQQQQNAAKEGWMAQYEKNGLTALADLASDIMGVRQFNRSEDYLNRMLDLYDRLVTNDENKVYADYLNKLDNRLVYPTLLPQIAFTTVSGRTPQQTMSSSLFKLNPKSIKIKGFEDGKGAFVDTRSDTTYKGRHEGRIPVGAGYSAVALGPLALLSMFDIPSVVNNPYANIGIAPTPGRSAKGLLKRNKRFDEKAATKDWLKRQYKADKQYEKKYGIRRADDNAVRNADEEYLDDIYNEQMFFNGPGGELWEAKYGGTDYGEWVRQNWGKPKGQWSPF